MQPPQESGFDWWHAATGFGGGALGTFLTWFWRAARVEPTIRADFEKGIALIEQKVEEKMELEAKAYSETLQGLRQKINDVELYTERNFLSNEFLKEYREDMREVKAMIVKNGHHK